LSCSLGNYGSKNGCFDHSDYGGDYSGGKICKIYLSAYMFFADYTYWHIWKGTAWR